VRSTRVTEEMAMTATTRPVNEGTIPYKGFETWYRIVGEGEEPGKFPLLCLHGGPGAAHDYLESLDAMAGTGRRVIYYDQIGCSRSSLPVSKPEMWTVELYVEEVDAVRQALGLDRTHLLGQSWGGMLAMEYALTQPKGLGSLTVSSSPASMIQWVDEANRLREDLPPEVQQTLLRHEAAGTVDSLEYQEAMQVFYDRHVCRVVPNPEYVQRSFASIAANPEVYHTMNGPSEFNVVGTLKEWDIIPRLGEIRVPTLVTSGRFDEATPLIAETVRNGIPGAEWVIFEESSHMAHVEEPERYMQVLDAFLTSVEEAAAKQG
jgi:proline-specific peptidase